MDIPFEFSYFSIGDRQKAWGTFVTCAGHSRSLPGAEFPSCAHPDQYYFNWSIGRVLKEWQIIGIAGGRGTVEFRHGRFTVGKGSLVVLAPGQWHRYRPDPQTGWTTFWIGFGGTAVAAPMGAPFFDPRGEVRSYPADSPLLMRLAETVGSTLLEGRDRPFAAATRLQSFLSEVQEYGSSSTSASRREKAILKALDYLHSHATETVDFAALAARLGFSYRTFRDAFAKETHTSPLQYQLAQRLARAKNLLSSSDLPIAEIADVIGFRSAWNFSHYFRKSTGFSPAEYRRRHAPAVQSPS